MILHAMNPDTPKQTPMEWWAVHAETLTPVHISILPSNIADIRVVEPTAPDATLFRSHPKRNDTPREIARDVMEEINRNFLQGINLGSLTIGPTDAVTPLPEHLLVMKANGENAAIFRTEFPRMIIPTRTDETMLGEPTHWTALEDLSAFGWAFYWEGCQQALDELAPAFIAAAAASA